MVEQRHPWSRYVALGDSFTEGIGDPEPASPGGHRGWADRVAEVLGSQVDDFAYANLAVRGKLLQQILDEQIEPALELRPDLITISAGGNDVIRPGTDPDDIASRFESGLARLRSDDATVVLFTGVDVGFSPVFGRIRGKVAIYNENLRALAKRYDCIVADQWSLQEIQDVRMWAPDRLHLNPHGHHEVARMVLDALAVENSLRPLAPEPLPTPTWRAARTEDVKWAREYLVPWVLRRVRHQSSGDFITAKRPSAEPYRAGADRAQPAPSAPGTAAPGNATPEQVAADIATAGVRIVVDGVD
ncbi:SGNH/GDSL hydrolase family protein [Rathayibacter sp. SD072]|uniref:SGNH/GDSL hydrolase family protein n=1 Tax=Rathayibacter sp. SD072 TaxID=2781731 RepID=UPI001A9767A7|nr:SGNH/GDSL hydrolase family protein [Rathayibacter sp. SD072]MBO0982475.1 SGNH/GDSL hydrolase family protein [Rathayibacter sp. SD072]